MAHKNIDIKKKKELAGLRCAIIGLKIAIREIKEKPPQGVELTYLEILLCTTRLLFNYELAERETVRAEKKMRGKEEEVKEAWRVCNDLKTKTGKKKFEAIRDKDNKTARFIILRDEWERRKRIAQSRWLAWQKIINPTKYK